MLHTVTPTKRIHGLGSMMSPLGSSPPTRADSSSPAQVFDMAADSDEEFDSPEGAARLQPSGKSVDSSPYTRAGSLASIDFDASTAAPSSTTAQEAAARRASLGEVTECNVEAKEQIDAFDLEDWDSPVSMMREVASPCRAARSFDSQQREVADAVRAELQVDLEALVHQAMDEIRSWVSEEIAFVRRGVQEEMRWAQEQRKAQEQSQVEELRQSLEEQRQVVAQLQVEELTQSLEEQRQLVAKLQDGSQMEKVQSDLKEHMRLIRRLQEDVPAPLAPTMLDTGRETRSSDRVAEARVVAEERKWRLRFENLESSLERQSESLETLGRNTGDLAERAAAREADIQRGLSASQATEQQLAQASREVAALREATENQAEQIRVLEEQLRTQATELRSQEELAAGLDAVRQQVAEVSEQAGGHESIIESHLLSIQGLKTEVDAGRDEVCALKQCSERHTNLMEKLEKEAATAESEMATVQECLEQHNELLATLGRQAEDLEVKAGTQEAQISKGKEVLGCLEEKMSAAEKDIANVWESLDEHGNSAARIAKKTEEDSKAAFEAIQALETQLSSCEKASIALCARVDAQEQSIERLDQKYDNLKDVEIKDTSQAIERLEAQVSAAESERLAELKVVCAKVEHQEGEVQALSSQFRTQLRAVRQGFGRALDELKESLAAKLDGKVEQHTLQEALATRDACLTDLSSKLGQLLSAEESLNRRVSDLGRLAEAMGQRDARREKSVAQQLRRVETELATKASMDELLNTNTALHNWVNETREALDRWLTRSLEQFRCDQSKTLQKHEGWVKNVTSWIEQVHVREQGLSHVILHIVQQGSPDLTKLLEEGLKMPRVPNLQPPKA